MPAGVTDLKPCANCGGPIIPICHRIRIDMGVADQNNLRQFAGMYTMFQNDALAAVFSPGANELVKFTTDVDEGAGTTLFICNACWMETWNICELIEKDNELRKRREEANGS